MIQLLRDAHVFSPRDMGRRDVLVADDKIAAVEKDLSRWADDALVEVHDVQGKILIPGLIDQHVHLTGGGGEGGPATRTPPAKLSAFTRGGTTTVVGCLGTDGTTRSMEDLLTKARALEEGGLSTLIYTGAYQVPPPTLTGSVRDDLILIDKVVGAGEIAISDHRSSQPTFTQLSQLAAEVRVGGMLGGKPGILHLHVGSGERGLKPVFEVVEKTEIPAVQFTVTHVSRSEELLEQASRLAEKGGCVDVTAGGKAHEAIAYLLDAGAPEEKVTVSSDGNGSLPRFDEDGNFVGLGVASPKTLFETLRNVVLPIERALEIFSGNQARILGLEGQKGKIEPGYDADLAVIDEDGFVISEVWARGRLMLEDGDPLVLGTFENEG